MREVMREDDNNALGLTSWIPTAALNALDATAEGGERTPLVTPKQVLLFAMLFLAVGAGASLMHYSVGLRILNP
jgi:hypothetical protein